jgi:DICT domain-containing protein/predicted DNA-binding transcriptional regulator AlpA
MSRFELSIGEIVERTGLSEPTLRVWERRYGFPQPRRTASGHRRYSAVQADAVARVLALRDSGMSIPAAISRVERARDSDSVSLFATLRELERERAARPVRKPALIALSHAIEDEALACAQARVALGCFQREEFYRHSQARWRELSSTAPVAAVLADFKQLRTDDAHPIEVPFGRNAQLTREWAIVLHGGHCSVCMVARELASSNVNGSSHERCFEALWSVDPDAVDAVARAGLSAMSDRVPDIVARAEDELAVASVATPAELMRLATAITDRTLAALP